MARAITQITVEPSYTGASTVPRKGLFARLVESWRAQEAAHQDSEIERYIATHGGVITDDLERQISRQFGGMVR